MESWLSVTGWLVLLVILLVTLWFWNATRVYKVFDKMGLKGPKPKFLIGNMDVVMKKGFLECYKDWEAEYGKVYGMFRSRTPAIVISDLDLVRDIMVKKFQSFPNRQKSLIADYKPWSEMLIFLRDDHWKHVRDKVSPAFSSGKLKKMVPVVQRCCKNLVSHVTKLAEKGEDVDAKTLSGAFTMDVIAGTGFGLEVNSLFDPDDPFVKVTNRILYPPSWMFTILFMLPFLTPVLRRVGIAIAPQDAVNYMMNIINTALKHRRQDDKSYNDMLQLLVDLEKDETQSQVDPELDHSKDLQRSSAWAHRGLTEGEIQSNSFAFLLAGYETTAAALSFLLFNLAGNPQCLEKVQQEIDEKFGNREGDYDVMTQLPYLDMCLNESLRLYPPGFLLDRECSEDTTLGELHVLRDFLVSVPVYSIHTNPAYWPDPLKFDPDRHTAEERAKRHPFSFMPFGMGPRNCIGMRKAQMETKMAVVAILQKFTPVLCGKSVYPPRISKHFRLGAEDGLWLQFKPRNT